MARAFAGPGRPGRLARLAGLAGVALAVAFAAACLPACATRSDAVVPAAYVDPTAKVTVLEFFSAQCPCQAQHDARPARALRPLRAARRRFPCRLVRGVDRSRRGGGGSGGAALPLSAGPRRRWGARARSRRRLCDLHRRRRFPRPRLYRGGIDSDKRDLHAGRPHLPGERARRRAGGPPCPRPRSPHPRLRPAGSLAQSHHRVGSLRQAGRPGFRGERCTAIGRSRRTAQRIRRILS